MLPGFVHKLEKEKARENHRTFSLSVSLVIFIFRRQAADSSL